MIYSVNYQSQHKATAQEIRCPYNQLGTIFKFIKENPNKRYVVMVPSDLTEIELKKVIEQVELVKKVAEDYTIQCENILQLQGFLSGGYNAYLRWPICDWETYSSLRDLEVSDIYIDGPLGFNIKKIAESKGNTKIRVSPTISPNAGLTKAEKKSSSFFIRPEDLYLYEDVIDVIDFNIVGQQEKEDTLYNIYNRGTFVFEIHQLIEHLPFGINNLMFKSEFAENRLNCGQKCRIPGRQCHYCEKYFTIISQLTDITTRD